MLSETWQSGNQSEESVVSHILSMREKLEKMRNLASTNLEQAQLQQKLWYDRKAREREFQPGPSVAANINQQVTCTVAATIYIEYSEEDESCELPN